MLDLESVEDDADAEDAESDAELDETVEEPIDDEPVVSEGASDETEEIVGDVESIVENDAAVEIEATQDVEVAIETDDEIVVEDVANDVDDLIEGVVEETAEDVEASSENVEEAAEEIVENEEAADEEVEEVDSEWQEVVSTEWRSGEPIAQDVATGQTSAVAPVAAPGPAESASVEALSDQAWIVMSNGAGFFCQVLDAGVWRVASLDEFYANDSANRSTVVWAHGFQTDISDATSDAFAFRSTLDRARATVGSNRACRLVVWKWASERATLPIAPDARAKMQIADYEGVRLAKFVGGIDGSNDVSFVGFSFGARVVGSALQTLATTPSRYMSESRSGKISLTLVSAACDYGAFDYGAYAQGAKLASCVLNVYNPSDYALRYYPFISETRSSALGVAPICGAGFVNAEGRLFNMSSQSVVGRDHSFTDVIKCVPRELLLESLLL